MAGPAAGTPSALASRGEATLAPLATIVAPSSDPRSPSFLTTPAAPAPEIASPPGQSVRAMRPSLRARDPKSAMKRDSMTSLLLLMASLFACFYIAGRLWQDAEVRRQLMSTDPSIRMQAKDALSVDETLRLIDCKEQQKKLVEVELELAAARSQGYVLIDKTNSDSRKTVVIGIFTSFGGQTRRAASRKNWVPTGDALKKLESDKGIVIRYVIGRSSNRGDMLDRQIDQESSETKDFLVMDDHVESDDDLTQKIRLFLNKAVNAWDADFYVKMDDNIGLNLDMVATMLSSHRDKPRVYVGCMKSGTVVSDPNAQWYEPDWWKFGEQKSEYHRHASGHIYGLSRSLAQYISINSAFLKEYKNEDVAVGAWMLGLDTEHVAFVGPNNGELSYRLPEMVTLGGLFGTNLRPQSFSTVTVICSFRGIEVSGEFSKHIQ